MRCLQAVGTVGRYYKIKKIKIKIIRVKIQVGLKIFCVLFLSRVQGNSWIFLLENIILHVRFRANKNTQQFSWAHMHLHSKNNQKITGTTMIHINNSFRNEKRAKIKQVTQKITFAVWFLNNKYIHSQWES